MNYQGTGPASHPDPQYYGTARNVSIMANGRYVAYESEATDLVSGYYQQQLHCQHLRS